MTATMTRKANVGGVMLDRPFKIRRLGHIGFSFTNYEEAKHFYIDLMGFRVSDPSTPRNLTDPKIIEGLGDPHGYFMRYAGDHHAFVIGNRRTQQAMRGPGKKADLTIGQISWQVQSIRECMD